MLRTVRLFALSLLLVWMGLLPAPRAAAAQARAEHSRPAQETGFLNRRITLNGVTYRFQVYLPEEWRRHDKRRWPIILFLHGRGERGSEGMWQTEVGLPEAVRDHPERWPFVIVMPQCPQDAHWTDPAMLRLAIAALDQESAEFHGDPDRTYLTGLSMGGYGAWELARQNPRRWAAVAIAASGVFWSYEPERWQQTATLPAEYARAVGRTPVWLFHGADDNVVNPRQSQLMWEAFKAAGGHIRLWIYQGLRHDCWTRAYNEPELPRWLLEHRLSTRAEVQPQAERVTIPLYPAAIRLSGAQLDSLAGEYLEPHGHAAMSISHQGEQIYEKDTYGNVTELAAESASELFYPRGSSSTRLHVERDAQGRVIALVFRDDRRNERWEKRSAGQ